MLRTAALSALGAVSVGTGALVYSFESQQPLRAADLILHPPKNDWWFKHPYGSFDSQTLRRGYLVYKNVCKACHSVKYLAFRELVGVCLTEEEAKAEAEECEITDGPDDTGEMFERPGKLFDRYPKPYRNDEEAKFANNGALPPDLSYITLARHGGEDYVFSLLTGYCEPPEGFDLKDGLHYNPYFAGGAIGMAPALYPGVYEYPDGTPSSVSQLAKDVTEFLSWISQPEMNLRKEMGIKFLMFMGIIIPALYYWKRQKWTAIKTMKMEYRPPPKATRQDLSGEILKHRKEIPK